MCNLKTQKRVFHQQTPYPMRLIILFLCASLLANAQTSKVEQAKALFENKKYPEAVSILEKIEDDNKDYAAAQYYLGRIAFEKKEYDDAADFFEEAVDTDDKVADYHDWLGNTYGTIAKDANILKQGLLAPKMKSAWEKAIALDPKNIEARKSLIQFYLQAPSIMGGSIDKAKEVAKQIVKLNAAEGHRSLGNIYLKEEKPAEAEKEYLQMAKADATYSPVLANFYVNQKQYDKAFNLFEEAIKKNAEDMIAIYQVGKTSAISGQKLDRGEECLKKYLNYTPKANEPSHGGANMRLAQIQEKKGDKAQAKKLYETALKLDSNLKEAKEGLERVSK
jgi:tetratricopeptide (TPR) repeat protein